MNDDEIDLNERQPGKLKKMSMNMAPEDFRHADALQQKIGRRSTRTEVFRRALHLLYWAIVKKEGDELVVLRKSKEVSRVSWADPISKLGE